MSQLPLNVSESGTFGVGTIDNAIDNCWTEVCVHINVVYIKLCTIRSRMNRIRLCQCKMKLSTWIKEKSKDPGSLRCVLSPYQCINLILLSLCNCPVYCRED